MKFTKLPLKVKEAPANSEESENLADLSRNDFHAAEFRPSESVVWRLRWFTGRSHSGPRAARASKRTCWLYSLLFKDRKESAELNEVMTMKLGPWLGVIDQILLDDQSQPKKQRHTAKRVWDRLKAEHAFDGCYTVVKDYVRRARLQHKEVFVPLAHRPGDAQADFGKALVVIAGVEQKAHFQCMDLPHSDDCFVVAFPAENTEAFLEGHNQAFAYFGGVPRTILYDNTRVALKEITGDEERTPTEAFSGLQSHYLFAAKIGRPGKGNDKGNGEGLVGYARRNFMMPVPRVGSWEELNTQLVEECRQRRERKLWGHTETISERFKRDREKLLPLPPASHEACQKRTTRASSQALVRYETNDYSVPTEHGHQQVLVKAFVWEVVISCSSEVIARHSRSYGQEETGI